MIHRDQVVINIVAASIPIIFGLVPGLFQELTAGARNFSLLLVFRHPRPYLPPIEAEPPKGLAVVGVVIIAATILAYLLN